MEFKEGNKKDTRKFVLEKAGYISIYLMFRQVILCEISLVRILSEIESTFLNFISMKTTWAVMGPNTLRLHGSTSFLL